MSEEVERVVLKGADEEGTKLSSAKLKGLGSSKNISGSKGNLLAASKQFGSFSNLLGRKSTSQMLKRDSIPAAPAPAANAIIYENTYKMKPDIK